MVEKARNIEIEEAPREEIIAEIDREAREEFGMSFDEFLAAYRSRSIPDTLVANELISLLRFAGYSRRVPA